jgi:hypothetical protein
MRSFQAEPAPYATKLHPARTSFADDVCGTAARLIAYAGAPALLAIPDIALAARFAPRNVGTCFPLGTAPSPSASMIQTRKQRLTRSSGTFGGR